MAPEPEDLTDQELQRELRRAFAQKPREQKWIEDLKFEVYNRFDDASEVLAVLEHEATRSLYR